MFHKNSRNNFQIAATVSDQETNARIKSSGVDVLEIFLDKLSRHCIID